MQTGQETAAISIGRVCDLQLHERTYLLLHTRLALQTSFQMSERASQTDRQTVLESLHSLPAESSIN